MFSVIICSINEGKFRRAAEMFDRLLSGTNHEIICLHDAASMAEGYNRGIAQAKGDILLFSHDDIVFLQRDFLGTLSGHLANNDVIGVAGTTRLCDAKWINAGMPYVYGQIATPIPATRTFEVCIWSAPSRRVEGMQAMDGVFLCVKRPVAQTIRFDAQTFRHFHLYDLDFTFRAYLAGHRLAVANDLYVAHESRGSWDDTWRADADKFCEKFRGSLAKDPVRDFKFAVISAATQADVVEIMTPPHWQS